MNNNVIETSSLTRVFGDLRAVDGVDLTVDSGSIFGLLGPNGSGKTTTIRLLLGLLEPSAGSARVLGFDTRTDGTAIRQDCGALLEHTGLYERLSAFDNLDFYGRVWHMPQPERNQRIQELLTGLKLWERRHEAVSSWSRGMKQKLAVARALLHHPRLVFLDEPTAGLDPLAAAALIEDIQQMVRQQGVTVFLTTHNLTEAEKVCDRVAVIRMGRLLSCGSPDELRMQKSQDHLEIIGQGFSEALAALLRQRPEVNSVSFENHRLELKLNGAVDTTPLVRFLIEQGVTIDEVRKGKASLEDVFMELVAEEHDHVQL